MYYSPPHAVFASPFGSGGLTARPMLSYRPQHAPNTRWVHSLWAGVDGLLSSHLRAREDVLLTNAKHAFNESLGEYAMLGMLYFAKQVPRCVDQHVRGHWEKYQVAMLKGCVTPVHRPLP